MSVFVIAEAGSNAGDDPAEAEQLIEAAAEAGADAVKFQALRPFEPDWVPRLRRLCVSLDIEFMCTPFDLKAVEMLNHYVKRWKIASAEASRVELIGACLATGKQVIVSTGMHDDQQLSRGSLVEYLLCTSSYPTPLGHVNLQAMVKNEWAGVSDHTNFSEGALVAVMAVAAGARIIEKHFTMSRAQEGPDHYFALEPKELAMYVEYIRDAEAVMGDGRKRLMPGEIDARGRNLTWGRMWYPFKGWDPE